MKIKLFIAKKKYILLGLIYLVFCSFCCVFSALTQSAYLDRIMTAINNPNDRHYYNGFVPPYLNVKKTDSFIKKTNYRYSELLDYFSYYPFTEGCRELVDDKIAVNLDEQLNLKLLTQNTFQISSTENSSKLFTVDKNMYYSYISPEDVADIMDNNYQIRNNCDTFIYVGDTFADKLIAYYENIPGNDDLLYSENKYLELVRNNKYSTLVLNVNDDTTVKMCINAVLSSHHRFGVQTKNVYGDFGVTFLRSETTSAIKSLSFDVDFKVNQYGNKKIISDLKALGYDSHSCRFSFHSFDYNSFIYFDNNNLNIMFLKYENDFFVSEYLFYALFLIGAICELSISFVKNQQLKYRKRIFFACISIFGIYGFLAQFISVIPLMSLFPAFGLLIIFVFNWKEVFKNEVSTYTFAKYIEVSI